MLGNAAVGAWWLDPVVGLLIAVVAAKEGAEAFTFTLAARLLPGPA